MVAKKPLVNVQLKSYMERLNLKLNFVKFQITGRFAALKNLELDIIKTRGSIRIVKLITKKI